MIQKVLEIKNLDVSYGSNKVLKDINLSIDTGKLVGIIGPSGSGKSTLIKAILDLIPIDRGNIKISGQSIDKKKLHIYLRNQR